MCPTGKNPRAGRAKSWFQALVGKAAWCCVSTGKCDYSCPFQGPGAAWDSERSMAGFGKDELNCPFQNFPGIVCMHCLFTTNYKMVILMLFRYWTIKDYINLKEGSPNNQLDGSTMDVVILFLVFTTQVFPPKKLTLGSAQFVKCLLQELKGIRSIVKSLWIIKL